MCEYEVVGDYYRGCNHFVEKYETGEIFPCNSPLCALSEAHVHTAPNCPCTKERTRQTKVQNMFQQRCQKCINEESELERDEPHDEKSV